jgi:hypothetical protein
VAIYSKSFLGGHVKVHAIVTQVIYIMYYFENWSKEYDITAKKTEPALLVHNIQ